jgi:N-acetylglucosaminyldiphosphoundecaprenol N-acetyl-beta-D-mannosaminyltransferase
MTPTREAPFSETTLAGMSIARVRSGELLDHVFSELAQRRGGWIATVNLDMLRRHDRDPIARELYALADVRVADGMPLVWASRLAGANALPERIAGSTFTALLAERAATEGRSLYLLGGAVGAAEGAAGALVARYPGLRIVGTSSPEVSIPPSAEQIRSIEATVRSAQPDFVLVGLGSPKQEYLIRALRPHLARSWMIGVGITFSFIAGQTSRAPRWMQRSGLEWVHRLVQEPRRLARRYLVDDLPFAVELFAEAFASRLRSRSKQ